MDENLLKYLPNINYDVYDVKNIKTHFANIKNKSIFISTSLPRSDQATKISLVPLLQILSEKYHNANFYITDPYFKSKNVFYTGDIIRNTNTEILSDKSEDRYNFHKYPTTIPLDIIESSYFSTFCDTIVGKSTGTYSYSLVEENITNNKTKFAGICNISLASANLHTILPNKFYSVTNGIEYSLQKNVDLISNIIEEKI